jgi:protein Mpv17
LTKAVTAALLNLVGDLICQLTINKTSSLDKKRTLTFTFLGLGLVGPTLHFWYFRGPFTRMTPQKLTILRLC